MAYLIIAGLLHKNGSITPAPFARFTVAELAIDDNDKAGAASKRTIALV